MTREEWKSCNDKKLKYQWANKCRKIQRSLQYNPDPKAVVRHHLRDTEEQRKYNEEHYEYFGFNQDGTFEYGKYIVFITEEEHIAIHSQSDETKTKIGNASKEHWKDPVYRDRVISGNRRAWQNEDRRRAVSAKLKGRHLSDEHKKKLSEALSGENHPLYGTHPSEETLAKRSVAISAAMTPEVRQKIREHMPDRHGENNPMYGKTGELHHFYGCHHTEETRRKISDNTKKALDKPEIRSVLIENGKKGGKKTTENSIKYKEYKSLGGTLTWNMFQKLLSTVQYEDIIKELVNK